MREVLVVRSWRWMVNLLTAGGISLHRNVGVIQSRSNGTWFGSGSFSLFKLYSLPLSPGRGLREFGQDIKLERKPTLSHNVVLVFVLGKDEVQTRNSQPELGGMDTIQLTDTPYRPVDGPSGNSKT